MHASTADLQIPGFTIMEASLALGESEFSLYRRVKRGEVAAVFDASNRLRIPYGELYALLRERELETVVEDAASI